MFKRLQFPQDALAEVLQVLQVGSGLTSHLKVRAPWAVEAQQTRHRAGFHVISAGECWAIPQGGTPIKLGEGDLIIFPHGARHVLADDPGTPSVDLAAFIGNMQSLDTPGHEADETVVLCGAYSFEPFTQHPLLSQLPEVLHLKNTEQGADLRSVLDLLTGETSQHRPGVSTASQLLVDLLLLYGLRSWIGLQQDRPEPTWLRALHDRQIGAAISAIHANPHASWTVETLGRLVGLSRAAFGRRFSQAVGEPPLGYVTRWRMTVARQLLIDGESITAAAGRVGYENTFAFAKAFKKHHGQTPGSVRRRAPHNRKVRSETEG
jgi:AraC-like DNA-binding protein